jgi:hypothetical protein
MEMVTEHRCPPMLTRGYRISTRPMDLDCTNFKWTIYDTRTHEYLIDVAFCPFCGTELHDEVLAFGDV